MKANITFFDLHAESGNTERIYELGFRKWWGGKIGKLIEMSF